MIEVGVMIRPWVILTWVLVLGSESEPATGTPGSANVPMVHIWTFNAIIVYLKILKEFWFSSILKLHSQIWYRFSLFGWDWVTSNGNGYISGSIIGVASLTNRWLLTPIDRQLIFIIEIRLEDLWFYWFFSFEYISIYGFVSEFR